MPEHIFWQFWWLIFPVGFMLLGAFRAWLSYRANREALDLMKTYVASGREPPAELLNRLSRRLRDDEDEDERPRYRRRRERSWYQVVLFGILSLGFAVAAATDIYGAGQAFVIVAFVMGALCAATLVQVLIDRNGPTI
ncbi:hypothetical protein [Caulobacter segnis]|jgi:hypothetical protein|uniref:hypothetical protein n=1 Tax=Caulobacter segnis TaxID=88688 RepID=UPI001CBD1606|nr:hypothetical protein [Caulobacter segnis]UAL08639.1 hypothetical protein K8940_12510 [Caulobacter segnis]